MLLFYCCFNYCFQPTFWYPSGTFWYTCFFQPCFRNAGVLQMSVLTNAIWALGLLTGLGHKIPDHAITQKTHTHIKKTCHSGKTWKLKCNFAVGVAFRPIFRYPSGTFTYLSSSISYYSSSVFHAPSVLFYFLSFIFHELSCIFHLLVSIFALSSIF